MPIYEWIYPNETSKMELLISREKKMKNLIEKAIYVDSLFETIVLNRNLGKNIEQCTHRNRDVSTKVVQFLLLLYVSCYIGSYDY